MKRIILLLLILILCPSADARMSAVMAGGSTGTVVASCADSSCTGFLYCQNFETKTTGWDNSETWTTSGTIDPANTTSPLRQSQSATVANVSSMTKAVTTDGEIYSFGRFSFSDITPTATTMIYKTVKGASDVSYVSLLTTGKLLCGQGSANNVAASALSADTTYYIWIYTKVASSTEATDGIITVSVSTTCSTDDIDVNLGCSVTNGTDDDLDIDSIRYLNSASGGTTIKIDQLLGKTTAIGTVCE